MKHLLLAIVFLGLSLITVGARPSATDISGTWAFSVNLEGGPQNVPMTFDFKQAGEKLTGVQSDGTGAPKLTGSVKGNKITFAIEGKNRNGDPYKNIFTGVIESPTRMSGDVEFPKGPGKWTATRKK